MADSIKETIRTLIFLLLLFVFAIMIVMIVAMRPPGALEIGWIVLGGILIGLPLYFLPTIIAFARRNDNKLVVFLINLLLGWSLIGWIAALILSFLIDTERSKTDQTVVVSQNVGNQNKQEKCLDIAKERYAKGEISKEEFEQLKKDLT